MSETTHDLTQRVEKWKRTDQWTASTGLELAEELLNDLSAALVQAEQEKEAALDHLELMRVAFADAQTWADKWREEAISQQARLASQEATIREVVREMRKRARHYETIRTDECERWADTLATLLPAEPTKVTP